MRDFDGPRYSVTTHVIKRWIERVQPNYPHSLQRVANVITYMVNHAVVVYQYEGKRKEPDALKRYIRYKNFFFPCFFMHGRWIVTTIMTKKMMRASVDRFVTKYLRNKGSLI